MSIRSERMPRKRQNHLMRKRQNHLMRKRQNHLMRMCASAGGLYLVTEVFSIGKYNIFITACQINIEFEMPWVILISARTPFSGPLIRCFSGYHIHAGGCVLPAKTWRMSPCFFGGFVDAAAGGGGLISLPAYLIAGLPFHTAIGINKVSS